MTSRLHHQLATYEVNIGGNFEVNIDMRSLGDSSPAPHSMCRRS